VGGGRGQEGLPVLRKNWGRGTGGGGRGERGRTGGEEEPLPSRRGKKGRGNTFHWGENGGEEDGERGRGVHCIGCQVSGWLAGCFRGWVEPHAKPVAW